MSTELNDKQNEVIEFADAEISHNKKRAMIEALIHTKNIVTEAAKMATISPRTHYLWMKTDPVYSEAVQQAEDAAIDFARGKLYELMEGVWTLGDDGERVYKTPPNPTALIFFLKTKGQRHGFIEKQQIDVNANVKNIPFTGIDLTPVEDVEYEEGEEGEE